jgi:hypothetical protein
MDTNEKIEMLVKRINEISESAETEALSEDGLYWEFVQTLGYGDGKLKVSNITDEAVAAYMKNLNKAKLMNFLDRFASVEEASLFILEGEVFGVGPGELHVELPADVKCQLEELTPDQFARVKKSANSFVDEDGVYINVSDRRLVLVLDVDAAREAIATI